MFFKNITEQKRAVRVLKGIAGHGRIANGYLFNGPPGSCQQEAAQAFVRLVNCEAPVDNDGCGECLVCRKMNKNIFPDLINIEPSGTKIKKEQIKSLAERIKHGPYEGKWLFIVIDQAEKMTTEAANSFLKILEEPAERTTFILFTFSENALLSTIVSRCQKIGFDYLAQETVHDENFTFEQYDMISLIRKAEEMSKDKELAKKYCEYLLNLFRQQKNFAEMDRVLKCLRKLNYNVNVRLCLEDMFLGLNRIK
ncbi:MAG: hypothetical protein ABIH39_03015 [Candidatus Margulisiibacteriota bacterium]